MDKKATLQELLTAFAAKAGLPRRRAEAFVRTFFDVIADALAREKFVRVKGLGTFKLVAVSERESVDVNTGERIQISGHTKVSFTPETSLRDLVNRPFAHFQTVVINEGTDLEALEAVDTPEITESSDALADEPETADDNDIPADEPKPAEPEAADSGTTEAEKTGTDDEAEQPAFIPPSAVDYFAEYPLDDTDNDDTPATNAADAPATDNETSDKADEAPVTDDATGDSDTGPTQEAPQTSAAANTLPKWEEALADETGVPDETQPATTGAAPARPESGLTEPGEAAGKHTHGAGGTQLGVDDRPGPLFLGYLMAVEAGQGPLDGPSGAHPTAHPALGTADGINGMYLLDRAGDGPHRTVFGAQSTAHAVFCDLVRHPDPSFTHHGKARPAAGAGLTA